MWTNWFTRSCINKDLVTFILDITHLRITYCWLKFSPYLGKSHSSLSYAILDASTCLLVEGSGALSLLDACSCFVVEYSW
jgi:hypothetical protein